MIRLKLRGFPREKKSGPGTLQNEVKKKDRVLRIYATMGISGIPGTGRKTLAYRLGNMERGVLENIPVAYSYTASYGHMFDDLKEYSRFLIRLTIYIIPEPEIPPPITRSALRNRGSRVNSQRWDDFCCLAVVFDVRNPMSFHSVSQCLSIFEREGLRVPTCFVVGNKSDLRSGPPPTQPSQEISQLTAYIEAANLGASYFELSAKYNIDVDRLSKRIFQCAIFTLRNWPPEAYS